MKNFLIVLLTGGLVLGALFVQNKGQEHLNWDARIAGSSLPEEPLKKAIHIAINPSIELDYKSKEEIYEIRRKYVRQYPELMPEKYKPSDVIFGQIVDGKPWWGELGISYYGPGENSIEGMAEESRFLVNPYLLVGVDFAYSFPLYRRLSRPITTLPAALEVMWESRIKAHAYFDVGTFSDRVLRIGFPSSQVKMLMLSAYNARDFGYNYLAVDLKQSENIHPFGAAKIPQQIKQFIHMGPSCGHPGMCNNMSPHLPEWFMPYKALPAKAHIKLWKNKPTSIKSPADFTFMIYMM